MAGLNLISSSSSIISSSSWFGDWCIIGLYHAMSYHTISYHTQHSWDRDIVAVNQNLLASNKWMDACMHAWCMYSMSKAWPDPSGHIHTYTKIFSLLYTTEWTIRYSPPQSWICMPWRFLNIQQPYRRISRCALVLRSSITFTTK